MTKIYTFLQKRKMRENHHGIIMIITAYILSFLMLFFGSDTFYNITSKAERIHTETNEETHEIMNNKQLAVPIIEIKANSLEYNTINSMQEFYKTNIGLEKGISQKEDIKEDTVNEKISMTKQTNETEKQENEIEKQTNEIKKQENENEKQTSEINKQENENDNQITENESQENEIETQGDTVWLLGHSMSGSEYNALLTNMDQFDSLENKDNITRGSIKSYSEVKKSSIVARGITNVELGMLERIVEAEATGEDLIGRILIANVIFNRVMSGKFPDSIKGVIFQRADDGYQFSPVSDHRFWSVNVSEKTKKAVDRALEGEDYSNGALYFMARRGTSSSNARWFDHNLNWLFKHGGHEFYK